MDPLLNIKIVCEPEEGTDAAFNTFGTDFTNGKVVVRSSDNSELLYIDGAADGGSPIYLGLTKSRGTQHVKLPVEAGDILGGVQVYGRIKEGNSLGYCHEETPLSGSVMFKVAEGYVTGSQHIPTELLFVMGTEQGLQIKLVIDSSGTLKVAGNIETGKLTITDEEVTPVNKHPIKFVKAIYNGKEFALPLYQLG